LLAAGFRLQGSDESKNTFQCHIKWHNQHPVASRVTATYQNVTGTDVGSHARSP
ncbi:uncharacterized protein FOBCDRAFT_139707, partial [Fusarium oxysporum Fo47]|uniref:uncharacterized protein n=1 Tax=Fusarium oxysporum Fo47 TaxID=660027 RepID=UPI0028699F9C